MLFMAYITIVKAGFIKDKYADGVSDRKFDILGIAITAYLLLHILAL